MKNIIILASFSFLTLSFLGCSTNKVAKKVEAPKGYVSAGNNSFKLLPYKTETLANGLKVTFIRDESLPRVSLTMLVKAGTVQELASKAGLNSLVAFLLEQGSQTRSANKIADDLGQLGTSLEISPGEDFTTFFGDSLSTGKEDLLALYADIMMSPAFKDTEIRRVRSQLVAMEQKKGDDPSTFASLKMDEYLYGSHPYSRGVNGTVATLNKLTKQNIIKHYLTFYRPNNSSLAVVGSFGDEYESKVKEVFGRWTPRTIPAPTSTPAPPIQNLEMKLIVKKGLQQTQIRIGAIGISRKNSDFLTLRLGNEVLGGGFASRLNQKVRDDLGLTYSIYSYFDARNDLGSFEVSTFTKNETAGKTLDETLQVINSMLIKGIEAKEVRAAKNQLVGQFPRVIETADRLAMNILALDFYNIGTDYLTGYNSNIEKISVSAVNEVMKKYLDTKKFKVVVYGDASIISQFEKYKPVIEKIK